MKKILTEIKFTQDMGRGVYASLDLTAGQEIEVCEILILSPPDSMVVNKYTSLVHYTFKYDQERDCLVLGNGEIFNHSDTANVSYTLETRDNRSFMVFRTLIDVPKDTQLFIDYNADTIVNVDSYLNNKSLI